MRFHGPQVGHHQNVGRLCRLVGGHAHAFNNRLRGLPQSGFRHAHDIGLWYLESIQNH